MTESHWGDSIDNPFYNLRGEVDDSLLLIKAQQEWADKEREALRARYCCIEVPHSKLDGLYSRHVEISHDLRKSSEHYFFTGKPTFVAIIKGDWRDGVGSGTYLFANDDDAAEFMLRYL